MRQAVRVEWRSARWCRPEVRLQACAVTRHTLRRQSGYSVGGGSAADTRRVRGYARVRVKCVKVSARPVVPRRLQPVGMGTELATERMPRERSEGAGMRATGRPGTIPRLHAMR